MRALSAREIELGPRTPPSPFPPPWGGHTSPRRCRHEKLLVSFACPVIERCSVMPRAASSVPSDPRPLSARPPKLQRAFTSNTLTDKQREEILHKFKTGPFRKSLKADVVTAVDKETGEVGGGFGQTCTLTRALRMCRHLRPSLCLGTFSRLLDLRRPCRWPCRTTRRLAGGADSGKDERGRT